MVKETINKIKVWIAKWEKVYETYVAGSVLNSEYTELP